MTSIDLKGPQNDLKRPQNDLKMTANDLKMTSYESVKCKKNKLKGGMTDDNPTQRSVFIEQVFAFS